MPDIGLLCGRQFRLRFYRHWPDAELVKKSAISLLGWVAGSQKRVAEEYRIRARQET